MSQHRPARLAAAVLAGALGVLAVPALAQSGQEPTATASVVPKNGVYSGRTGQGTPISLTVRSHDYVTRAQFTLRNNCGRTTVTFTPAGRGIPIRSNGRFRYESSTTDLSGKFVNNRKVRGAVSNTTTIFGPFGSTTCQGGSTYVARR
jgi:hypothetical protein